MKIISLIRSEREMITNLTIPSVCHHSGNPDCISRDYRNLNADAKVSILTFLTQQSLSGSVRALDPHCISP
jgi:hypothetical protein